MFHTSTIQIGYEIPLGQFRVVLTQSRPCHRYPATSALATSPELWAIPTKGLGRLQRPSHSCSLPRRQLPLSYSRCRCRWWRWRAWHAWVCRLVGRHLCRRPEFQERHPRLRFRTGRGLWSTSWRRCASAGKRLLGGCPGAMKTLGGATWPSCIAGWVCELSFGA
jgi:hypothetical protein